MNSFTSSFREPVFSDSPAGLRRFSLILLCTILASLLSVELCLRYLDMSTPSGKLVDKVLAQRVNHVVLGDSHVGLVDHLQNFSFLGRPGASLYELDRIGRSRFRWQVPGHVMIEVGPQMFAAKRHLTWRGLLPGSLERQHLPLSLYILEPEMLNELQRWLKGRMDIFSPPETEEVIAIRRKLRDWVQGSKSYYDIDELVHSRYMKAKKPAQIPIDNLESSLAWLNFLASLEWLQEQGARVCLVRAPLTNVYAAQLNAEDAVTNHVERMEQLAQNLGVRYVDYLALGFGELSLDYFLNADHLSTVGSALFWPKVEQACYSSP
ncbi:MAG: hypothetical protein ACJAYC_002462 [Halieaceae bacterium]|jgi:hypothetical protein